MDALDRIREESGVAPTGIPKLNFLFNPFQLAVDAGVRSGIELTDDPVIRQNVEALGDKAKNIPLNLQAGVDGAVKGVGDFVSGGLTKVAIITGLAFLVVIAANKLVGKVAS